MLSKLHLILKKYNTNTKSMHFSGFTLITRHNKNKLYKIVCILMLIKILIYCFIHVATAEAWEKLKIMRFYRGVNNTSEWWYMSLQGLTNKGE